MTLTTTAPTRRRPARVNLVRCSEHIINPADHPTATARQYTRDTLRGLDPDLVDDTALIATELVANAIEHAYGTIILRLTGHPDYILVSVQDSSPEFPEFTQPTETSETGRGMLIINSLAQEHGFRMHPDHKEVWARIQSRPVAARRPA